MAREVESAVVFAWELAHSRASEPVALRSWVAVTARREASRKLARWGTVEPIDDPDTLPATDPSGADENAVDPDELRRFLAVLLHELTEQQAIVLRGRLEGMSDHEIAAACGLSRDKVRRRFREIRKKATKILQQLGPHRLPSIRRWLRVGKNTESGGPPSY